MSQENDTRARPSDEIVRENKDTDDDPGIQKLPGWANGSLACYLESNLLLPAIVPEAMAPTSTILFSESRYNRFVSVAATRSEYSHT